MDNPGYIALSRQMVLERQMAVVSNNIANQTTTGFQREGLLFRQFLQSDSKGSPEAKYAMVEDWASFRDTKAGTLTPTGNPLDIALVGKGYLSVQGADGQSYYSRAGRLSLNENRQLVNRDGLPVLDAGGGAITLPASDEITIARDGTISAGGQSVARLGLFEFADPQSLQPGPSGGLYSGTDANPSPTTHLQQGFVEESNVSAIVEMTQMIDLSRQYQSNLRLIEAEHQRQRDTIAKLSRLV